MSPNPRTTIDADEVARFSALADEWWNPSGKFKPLHKFNPVRLRYITEKVCAHFGRDPKGERPFDGLRVLDIGCGGGLLCEPMARLGAEVVGADPARTNVEVARIHAERSGLADRISYREATAEALRDAHESFDVVLNMEVVEHVADVSLYMEACCAMVRPGGLQFVATINRTPKAWLLALRMAEDVLRWLPKGTHQYEKLVKPEELYSALRAGGMEVLDETGVFYNVLADEWRPSRDMSVNYMLVAGKRAAS